MPSAGIAVCGGDSIRGREAEQAAALVAADDHALDPCGRPSSRAASVTSPAASSVLMAVEEIVTSSSTSSGSPSTV